MDVGVETLEDGWLSHMDFHRAMLCYKDQSIAVDKATALTTVVSSVSGVLRALHG